MIRRGGLLIKINYYNIIFKLNISAQVELECPLDS